tara:strand:+ start:7011 stop:7829 length:819 start_codon:yes stop_codon:yes gene_type:complete
MAKGNYTLTYSESSKGFPSFYSYYPDWMIGMNQFFYTFNGGNLWRHNTNPTYNSFYGNVNESTLTTVFNEMPLENKIFKTLNLESDESWDATLVSDLQNTGVIDYRWFEKKEAAWFAFVRNDGPTGANTDESQWELRSLNGIGRSVSVGGPPATYVIDFDLSIDIGSIISVGDDLYFAVPPFDTPVFAGTVTLISIDKVNGQNSIVIDGTAVGATNPIPIQDAYFLFIKNPIAESHGILGHYCEVKLTLPVIKASNPTELFAIESEVMKSFP